VRHHRQQPSALLRPPWRVWAALREQISLQSTDNKQGREKEAVPVELQDKVLELLKKDQSASYANYSEILNDGIARELARINLPLSMYTEWYWQMDLHNLFHFLKLRLDSHAQYEIRVYAEAIAEIVKREVPMAWESFERHSLNAVKFSADEMDELRKLITVLLTGQETPTAVDLLADDLREDPRFKASNNRKVRAFLQKLGV